MRRVKRALAALFRGAEVGKDVVSRTWRKVKADWDAWNRRDLASEDVVRLILDGTIVRVRLDRKATNVSLLVVLGVRRDGQKLLLAVRNMGGESEAAWRSVLDDLIARGLRTPEFLVIDGGAGLERALAALWPDVPAQRCTVHKHRNLLAHAPETLHEEVSADYTDMIYAASAKEVEAKRKAFLRKWRLKCPGVAASLEEAGERLFAFLRLPQSQWKSARTTNAIERLHEEFKRRIKTQTVLPSAETAAMLFWALLASGQITMRKVDGWQTLAEKPAEPSRLTSPPDGSQPHRAGDNPLRPFPHIPRRYRHGTRFRHRDAALRLAARIGLQVPGLLLRRRRGHQHVKVGAVRRKGERYDGAPQLFIDSHQRDRREVHTSKFLRDIERPQSPNSRHFARSGAASFGLRVGCSPRISSLDNPEVSARSPGAVGATGTAECDLVETGLS